MNVFNPAEVVMADQVMKDAQAAQNIITRAKEAAKAVDEKAKMRLCAAEFEAKKCLDAAKEEAARIVQMDMFQVEERLEAMNVELAHWEEEKKRIASTHSFESTIFLDVGGHSFKTTLATLTRFPDSMLGAMFSGRHALTKNEAGAHFIDRDGRHFHYILNFLRDPESWESTGFPQLQGSVLTDLRIEADYYGLKDLMFFGSAEPLRVGVTRTAFNRQFNQLFRPSRATTATVSQGSDQLWYLKHDDEHVLRVLTVCDKCGCGVIGCPHHLCQCFVINFKTTCTVGPTQPSMSVCLQCLYP